MNHSITFPFRQLCRGFLPAALLWAFASSLCATPIFEPVQGFVNSPQNPKSKLIQGSDGDFYGTASSGGTGGLGTVFKQPLFPCPPVLS
jgi:uncharacterized repeat protein (TIGR03803 family)